ncbi:hypothetical protein CL643_02520 [bacterium]|nr:hypothetical protein [bacterium]
MNKEIGIFLLLALSSCSGSQPTNARVPSAATSTKNRPPVIESLETSPKFVSFSGEATTRAIASDPDFDRLDFLWEITGGKILEGKNTPFVKWKADEGSEKINIKVTVKDSDGYKEENLELKLTKKNLFLEEKKPEKEKHGEEYKIFLKTINIDSFSMSNIQINYPSEKIKLKNIVFNGLEKKDHEDWYSIIDTSKIGKIKITLLPKGEKEKNGGKIATVNFILRDDSYPLISDFSFKQTGKEIGFWNKVKEIIPVALSNPK